MSVLTGTISPYGPLIHFMAMQSRERVEALKKAGISFSSLGRVDNSWVILAVWVTAAGS